MYIFWVKFGSKNNLTDHHITNVAYFLIYINSFVILSPEMHEILYLIFDSTFCSNTC